MTLNEARKSEKLLRDYFDRTEVVKEDTSCVGADRFDVVLDDRTENLESGLKAGCSSFTHQYNVERRRKAMANSYIVTAHWRDGGFMMFWSMSCVRRHLDDCILQY